VYKRQVLNELDEGGAEANNRSQWRTFTVSAPVGAPTVPTCINSSVAEVTTNSARLGGTITSDGGIPLTERGTCWGLVASPVTNCTTEGSTALGDFSHVKPGMLPNTPYHYRAFGRNAIDYGWCGDDTFTTLAAAPVPDLSAINTSPAANTAFLTTDTITFTGTAQNSAAAAIAQGGWADVEIDWNSDGAGAQGTYDLNINAFNGNKLWAFNPNQSKVLSYLYPNPLPVGNHRYRFNVDVLNELDEGGAEANNRSQWRTFTVSAPVGAPSLTFFGCDIPNGSSTCVAPFSIVTNGVGSYNLENRTTLVNMPNAYVNPLYAYNGGAGTPAELTHGMNELVIVQGFADKSTAYPVASCNPGVWNPVSGKCEPIAAGTPDLVALAPIASAGSVVQGGTINFTGTIQNIGLDVAGPYNVGVFYIDNNNDGTAEYSVPATRVNVNTNPSGSKNSTGSWTVPGAAFVGGNYRIGYYADVDNEVNEGAGDGNFVNWSGWSAPFSVTAAAGNPDCPAEINHNNCDLEKTPFGGTSGMCTSGYSGNCHYTCNVAATWGAPSDNKCTPLMDITLFKVCDPGQVNCVFAGGTKTVDANAPLEFYWGTAPLADFCQKTSAEPINFSTGNLPSGNDKTVNAHAAPGVPKIATISCVKGFEAPVSKSITIKTNAAAGVPILTASKRMVNINGTVDLTWENVVDESLCSLTGGSLNMQPPTLSDGNKTTGTKLGVIITGKTTFILTCPAAQPARVTIDVIPDTWEH